MAATEAEARDALIDLALAALTRQRAKLTPGVALLQAQDDHIRELNWVDAALDLVEAAGYHATLSNPSERGQ